MVDRYAAELLVKAGVAKEKAGLLAKEREMTDFTELFGVRYESDAAAMARSGRQSSESQGAGAGKN